MAGKWRNYDSGMQLLNSLSSHLSHSGLEIWGFSLFFPVTLMGIRPIYCSAGKYLWSPRNRKCSLCPSPGGPGHVLVSRDHTGQQGPLLLSLVKKPGALPKALGLPREQWSSGFCRDHGHPEHFLNPDGPSPPPSF